MRRRTAIAWAAGIAAGAACRTGVNYPSLSGPRYIGIAAPAPHGAVPPATIRLVTFNIRFAREIDSAIVLLQSSAALAHADIIALQEMDAAGTSRIADALGMSYVYYPASVHPATGRDFGNAILTRWPIQDDAKVILPHLARFRKTERIATAATLLINGIPVRVYSVHLSTQIGAGPGARRDQVRAVLADAAAYPRVIVSGDMNSHGIGEEFRAAGYTWPTEHNPRTELWWNWDHVFLRGLALRDGPSTGVVRHNRHASDHRPVWAVVALHAPEVP
jgi:endonuclease/exonuclease/phosphatase family metal-dependent hydrolase